MTLACESGDDQVVGHKQAFQNRKQTSTSAELNSRQVREDAEWESAFCNPYSSKRELPTVPSHHSVGSSRRMTAKGFYPKLLVSERWVNQRPVSYPKFLPSQKVRGQGNILGQWGQIWARWRFKRYFFLPPSVVPMGAYFNRGFSGGPFRGI